MENVRTTVEDLKNKFKTDYIKMIKENKFKDLVRSIGLFPDQTIENDVLILGSNPNATCVKRMKEWNYYKRSIKKNESGIKVISHTIFKNDLSLLDKENIAVTKGVERLNTEVGYVFDISQTQGVDYKYLNTNKENVAKHFEVVKNSIENSIKGFDFEYVDQEENSRIDYEKNKVLIKDGSTIDVMIKELVKCGAEILVNKRFKEGLENIEDIEVDCVVYAISSKLGLDLPEINVDFTDFTDEKLIVFKENLQKVRSVTKQMLSNIESAIEYEVRQLNKEIKKQSKLENNSTDKTNENTVSRKSEVEYA